MRSTIIIAMLLTLLAATIQAASANEHRLYGGIGWTHWSNADAGQPLNDDPEDNGDHVGVNIEYQYVDQEDDYFYMSLGVGKTKVNTRNQSGWDCSGCALPTEFRVGYKWRIF